MRTAVPTRHLDPCLYDEDFYAWTMTAAALLRQWRFAEIDIAYLLGTFGIGEKTRGPMRKNVPSVF